MATRIPLVLVAGQIEQLQSGDAISAGDPAVGSYAPGGLSLADGQYAHMVQHLILTGSQTATLAGSSRLRIG